MKLRYSSPLAVEKEALVAMRIRSQSFRRVLLRAATASVGILVFCLLVRAADGPSQSDAAKMPARPSLVQHYGKLPLSFEINQGQTDPSVKFLSRGPGYRLCLTGTEAMLALHRGSTPSRVKPGLRTGSMSRFGRGESKADKSEALRMALLGANQHAKVLGLEELTGKTNYFIGNDPQKWRTNLPTYAKVKYEGVYPGIDLVYYGNQGQLEYDFVVAPGADPNVITLVLTNGAGHNEKLKIDASGDLVIPTGDGEIRFHNPAIYQAGPTSAEKRFLDGHFVLKGKYRVGFEIASYDRSKPLVIDPVLAYSTFYGGGVNDAISSIAVDASGNTHVTGFTDSFTDFPTNKALSPNFGGSTTTHNYDAFVAKLKADGTGYIWSTYLGGTANDKGLGIALDGSGNVYVTGVTDSSNFPVHNAYQSSIGVQSGHAFVTKIDPSGSSILYSSFLGGEGGDSAGGTAIAANGSNAYITGDSSNSNIGPGQFPIRNGIQTESDSACQRLDTTQTGVIRGFVARIDTAQSGDASLIYSSLLCAGGPSSADPAFEIVVVGNGVAADGDGNAYIIGWTNSPYLITRNAFQSACRACTDFADRNAFAMKINTNDAGDGSLKYATYLGGTGFGSLGGSIVIDGSGYAYVVGTAESNDFPTTPNVLQPQGNLGDAFVAKLAPSQSGAASLIWSTYLGGTGADSGNGIALDGSGNIYITGLTSGGFPILNTPQPTFAGGDQDAFVAKIKSDGSAVLYATYLGGSGNEGVRLTVGPAFIFVSPSIAVDASGNAYIGGATSSADFPTLAGYLDTLRGAADGFIVKLMPKADFSFAPVPAITADVGGSGSKPVQVNSVDEFNLAVTLNVPSPPSGFTTAFGTNPVTPPSDGSATSALTVNLGPSVTPGTYNVSVTGTSGALTHSVSTTVTVNVTPAGITQVIGTDQALGCIDNAGIGNALTSKLAAAQAYIDAGDIQSAINTLTALLNQLYAQSGKHIKTTCFDANGNPFNPVQVLIAYVQDLLARLGANVIKPNPVMGYAVNSSNTGIPGAIVSVVNSAKTVVASATTDATGFYFFAKTRAFTIGSNYTVKVTPPKPYRSVTSPTFSWKGTAVTVANSVLN